MSFALLALMSAAILVFWALGAYNRLVRLRAQVSEALNAVVQAYQAQASMLQSQLAPALDVTPSSSQWMALDEPSTRWRKASLAAQQLLSCLSALNAKAHKLPALDDISAVRAARGILLLAWQSAVSAHEDLAGAAAPAELLQRWQEHERLVQDKQASHHASVHAYQGAITQFPALLISWLFGFAPTASLIE
jgi:LemA protein